MTASGRGRGRSVGRYSVMASQPASHGISSRGFVDQNVASRRVRSFIRFPIGIHFAGRSRKINVLITRAHTYLHTSMATARRETSDPLPSPLESKSKSKWQAQLALFFFVADSRSTKRQSAPLPTSLAEGRDATWKVRRSQLPKRSLWTKRRRRYFWKLSRPTE